MADKIEECYRITARQLFEETKARKVIPGTLSLDVGLNGGLTLGSTVVLGGKQKSGKAQPLTAKVLTPTGFVEMGSLHVGDAVISQDGTACKVIGVYPQGRKECYEVIMSDGGKTVASEDHLWLTSCTRYTNNDFSIKTTKEIKSTLYSTNKSKNYNQRVPFADPISAFDNKIDFDNELDPYVLGCLLGDGNISGKSTRFTSADKDVVDKISKCISDSDIVRQIDNHEIEYTISKKKHGHNKSDTTASLIKYTLMGTNCFTKFIPKMYLFAPIDIRLELLRGLLDTDGNIGDKDTCIEYCTVSKQLAEDVMFLAGSLGARCIVGTRTTHFTYLGEKKAGALSYRIRLSFYDKTQPFSMHRKADRYKNSRQRHRQIKSVTSAGELECQCIEVDHPSGLYITDDFIVTHNTTTSLQFAANAQRLYKSKIFVVPVEGRMTSQVLSQVQGLNLDDVEVLLPPQIVTRGKVVGSKKLFAEQYWQLIGNTIVANPRSMIIVDSIANMSSEREMEDDMGSQTRGGAQKLESEFCRKFGGLIGPNECCLALITQIQANTGGGMGPQTSLKIGNHLKHQADTIMFYKWNERWKPDAQGRIRGHDIHITIECSSLGSPYTDVVCPLRYGFGLDNTLDVTNFAITWGFIRQSGSYFSIPFKGEDGKEEWIDDGEDKDLIKLHGEEKMYQWFSIHPKCLALLEAKIRSKIFL